MRTSFFMHSSVSVQISLIILVKCKQRVSTSLWQNIFQDDSFMHDLDYNNQWISFQNLEIQFVFSYTHFWCDLISSSRPEMMNWLRVSKERRRFYSINRCQNVNILMQRQVTLKKYSRYRGRQWRWNRGEFSLNRSNLIDQKWITTKLSKNRVKIQHMHLVNDKLFYDRHVWNQGLHYFVI